MIELQERIGAEPVEAVKARGPALPHGEKPGDEFPGPLLNPAEVIGRDAAHMIVVARPDGAEFFLGIDVYEFPEKARHLGNLDIVNMIGQMAHVNPDMLNLMVRVHNPPAFPDFSLDGSGH